jgi:methanol--5-hydroxybenzimidazolylcobamide Co-methyltransferase
VSLEQLVYAARLMNTASAGGPEQARLLQQWLVESDSRFDPQAYVLRPDVVLELASAIVEEPTPYLRVRRGAAEAARVLRSAHSAGRLEISDRDAGWLDMLSEQIDALPDTEDELEAMVRPGLDPGKVLLEEYAPLEGSSRSAA